MGEGEKEREPVRVINTTQHRSQLCQAVTTTTNIHPTPEPPPLGLLSHPLPPSSTNQALRTTTTTTTSSSKQHHIHYHHHHHYHHVGEPDQLSQARCKASGGAALMFCHPVRGKSTKRAAPVPFSPPLLRSAVSCTLLQLVASPSEHTCKPCIV